MSTAVTEPNPEQNPDPSNEPPAGPSSEKPGRKRPDSVQLAIGVWLVAFILELVHQVLQVITTIVDPADLLYAARQQQEESGAPVTDDVVGLATYGSIIGLGVINLIFVVILLVGLRFYAVQHKLAGSARSLLMIFSIFFAFRGLLAFGSIPAGTNVPDWLLLLDGSLQIIIAVAAVLAVVFSSRKEALEYTGESLTRDGDSSSKENKRK